MFKVGDVVRLNSGWTPLIVLSVSTTNRIIAKYANSKWNPITPRDYNEPERASNTQARSASEFTLWDGNPIQNGNNYIMTHKTNRIYTTIPGLPKNTGTYLATTSTGRFVIELPSGRSISYLENELVEVVPQTFQVRSINSTYTCNYEIPSNIYIQKGDILISESNNIYVVQEVNTKCHNTKGVFVGRRMVTSEL